MRKPIYLPAPPAEIHLNDAALSQLAAIRHREAQLAATIGIIFGAFIALVISSTFG